jgi:HK97 family phage major capsid protein
MNPRKQLEEAREKLSGLKAELKELAERDDLTEDEDARFTAALAEWDQVSTDEQRLDETVAKLDTIEARSVDENNRSSGDGTRRDVVPGSQTDDIFDLRTLNSLDPTDYGSEIRDRAMRCIEAWPKHVDAAARETAERHVALAASGDKDSQIIARHILRTGNPDYVEAFYAYLRNPATAHMSFTREQQEAVRAALNEGTTTQGGFLVPPFLDPTIILTNVGTINPFRQIATIKTIGTQTWKGVTSAGVTAEWTAEAAEVADASPTFAQPSITPVRADAYIQASLEMLEDTDISGDIGMLLADARDRLESTAFAVGTGSTQPKGIVTALQAVTASRVAGSSGAAGAADFVLADVYALANALPPRYRPNSSWMAEQSILNRTRRFGEGSTANAAFWADLGVAIPPLLLGRPVYQSSEMDSTIVSGSNDDILILGDFRQYYIVDRIGMQLMYEPLVKGANRRPTGEVGWVAFWRVGGDTVNADAFRMLRV